MIHQVWTQPPRRPKKVVMLQTLLVERKDGFPGEVVSPRARKVPQSAQVAYTPRCGMTMMIFCR